MIQFSIQYLLKKIASIIGSTSTQLTSLYTKTGKKTKKKIDKLHALSKLLLIAIIIFQFSELK